MITTDNYPMFETFYSCEKVNFEKNTVLPIEKVPSFVLSRDTIMLRHLIIQFPLYYLTRCRLWEVKNKTKFQSFSSKSGRGRLREVVAYKRFQI